MTVPSIEWFTDWSHSRTNGNPGKHKLTEWIKYETTVEWKGLCYVTDKQLETPRFQRTTELNGPFPRKTTPTNRQGRAGERACHC